MKKWPTDPVNGLAPQAPTVQEPENSPSIHDIGAMSPEEVEARAKELEDALRAARREVDEAAVSLATARAGLVEAAGRGFEAAKAAQRRIAEEEERLRTAALVTEAVENANRPVAEAAHRISRARSRERFGEAQSAKLAERDGIEAELVATLDVVAGITVRWEKATFEVLEIRRSAAQASLELQYVEPDYRETTVARTIQSLGIVLARAVAS